MIRLFSLLIFIGLVIPGLSWGQASPASSGSPADRDLTVLPLLSLGADEATTANLSGLIFTHLRGFEGISVRIRAPSRPLTLACLKEAACIRQVGLEVGAGQLLLGVVQVNGEQLRVTLVLFDVAKGATLSRQSIELSGDTQRFGRMISPVVEDLAVAAGGRPLPPPPPTSQPTSEATSGGAAPPSGTTLSSLVPAGQVSSATPVSASESLKDEEEPLVPKTSSRETVREQEKALEKRAREESAAAARERKGQAKDEKERVRLAKAEAEMAQKEAQAQARQREAEAERVRREEEARRLENMKREKKGLPPLPAPEKSSPIAEASDGRGVVSTTRAESHAPKIFLENEGRYQVGLNGGVGYFVGYGLLGGGLELCYEALPWLWLEGSVESHSSANAATGTRFFFISGRAGAVARGTRGPLHPFAGLDGLLLNYGPYAFAGGAMARGGVDLMINAGVGIRLDLGAGVVYSETLSGLYLYPSSTQAWVRFGMGMRYHF